MKPLLAPSILSADPLALADSVRALGNLADWIHIDVMDGHFVPNLTFGPAHVRALRREFPTAFLDVHLMVEPVADFLDMFMDAEPSALTIHIEATPHIHRELERIRARGIMAGVTLNPGTPVCAIESTLSSADLVLVMSVNPGAGGQKFIEECGEKVKELVRLRAVRDYRYLIEIDGGVSAANAGHLARIGCDVLVAGNAVFGAEDPALAAKEIKRLALAG